MNPRILPHNLDAEASVLGGIILRNAVLAQLDRLETEDFYSHHHRVVFEAIRNLEAARRPIDVVTLENEIEKRGKLDAIGGIAFLGELALRVPTADNVEAYAKIVTGYARVRSLALGAGELAQRAAGGWDEDPDELVGHGMAMLSRLDRSRPDEALPIGELVKRRVKELEDLAQRRARGETALNGAPTGIAGLDRRIGGYPFGDVSLLAARPGMGKTAMAMSAVDAATVAGFGTHVFSQEGGWRMYADRCLSRASGISVERIRQGDLQPGDASKIGHALMRFGLRTNWVVDDRAGLSAGEIIRSVRRWKAKLKTRLVVVDYVQILRRTRGLSENDALDEIITAFSHAALAEDIAFLVLSQLNRDVEKRPDKRPQMSDLRGSGALEERPRVIVSPYRGAYYTDKAKRHIDYDCDCDEAVQTCKHKPSDESFQKTVQVLLLKNNNGEPGRVFASWNAPTTEMW